MVSSNVVITSKDIEKIRERLLSNRPLTPRLVSIHGMYRRWANRLENEPQHLVFDEALRSGFHAILCMTASWLDCLQYVAPYFPRLSDEDQQHFAFVVSENGFMSIEDVRILQQYCSDDWLLGPLLPEFERLAY